MTTAIDLDDPDLLALPPTSLASEVLELVRASANATLFNHSLRSYLFAKLVARERGFEPQRDFEPELLFCACALHDIGLTDAGNRGQRFEVDGADVAADLLTRRGVSKEHVDMVWQAIALNTSPGIVERRGIVCALTLAGVSVDIVGNAPYITDATAQLIHEAYPRRSIGSVLTEAVLSRARSGPDRAPLFSMSAQLIRERETEPHVTTLETLAWSGRWRE